MSTHTYSEECPNCGYDMESYQGNRPITTCGHYCPNCGWLCQPEYLQVDLEEFNEYRKEHNEMMGWTKEDEEFLPPLKELPECITNPYEAIKERLIK